MARMMRRTLSGAFGWLLAAAIAITAGPVMAAEPDYPTEPDRGVSGVKDVDPMQRRSEPMQDFDRRDRMTPPVSAGGDEMASDPSNTDPDDPRSGRGARKTDKQLYR